MLETNNKTIFKNTVFLYLRTVLLIVLGLYTSRITMQALGVENYGIINVVGGFVSMFALISGSLTSACQRFITFELGRENGSVRLVFSTTFYIHLILAAIICILAETVGLYFVNHKLNLPAEKMPEVQWVFQCSVISFILNLINIPYNALIIAHEKLKSFAYISILEGVFKFLTVYSIVLLPYSSLKVYSCLTLLFSIIIRLVYQIYCKRSFKNDAKLTLIKDYTVFKKIFGFAGWAFVGNSATLLNNQGLNIILNIFVGVTVNAARGIASMVESTITGFVNNFTTALNPQITKAYAHNDKGRIIELLDLGMRLSYFLIIVMAVPIILITPDILCIWLGVYPDYAIPFIRITLLIAMVQSMANPFITAVCATGDIRHYQLTVGGLTLINVPFCYLLLRLGYNPISVYWSSLFVFILTFFIRLWFIKTKVKIPVNEFLRNIILRILPLGIISWIISYLLSLCINTSSFVGLVLFGISTCSCIAGIIYIIGLKNSERLSVNKFIKSRLMRHDR